MPHYLTGLIHLKPTHYFFDVRISYWFKYSFPFNNHHLVIERIARYKLRPIAAIIAGGTALPI